MENAKQHGPTKACYICKDKPSLRGYATCGHIRCRRESVMYRRGLRPQYAPKR